MALVALAQAASIGPTVRNPDGSKSSVNGDFVAQGLGNLGGGLFGALAAQQSGLRGLERGPRPGSWRFTDPPARIGPGEVRVLFYGGASLFAEAPRIDAQWPDVSRARGSAVVLALRTAPEVPSSAVVKLLSRYAQELDAHGGRLYLAGVQPRLLAVLRRTGLAAELGDDRVVPARREIFGAQNEAVERAERWVAERRAAGAAE
ncbi:STAS domain-containing protein [Streptomyces sp. NPDC002530]